MFDELDQFCVPIPKTPAAQRQEPPFVNHRNAAQVESQIVTQTQINMLAVQNHPQIPIADEPFGVRAIWFSQLSRCRPQLHCERPVMAT